MGASRPDAGRHGAPDVATPAYPEVSITRVFDAPRELVFQVWTDPLHLMEWWGPHHFTIPECTVDLRPGGALLIVMRAPDGSDFPMTGVFREIVPPERLVFLGIVDDPKIAVHFEVLTTVTFADQGGKTLLTLRAEVTHATAAAAPMLGGMDIGWTQSLEKLGDYVNKVVAQVPTGSASR